MKKKYDAVATVGKYTNKDGDEKKRYLNVGTVFENEEGRLSMKLEALPIGTEWTGWVSFYEPKGNDDSTRKMHGSEPRRTAAGGVAVDRDFDMDSDVPF